MTSRGLDLCRAVAGHGLPGSTSRWPEGPLEADVWGDLLTRVKHQRLAGFLALAIADGTLPVTRLQHDQAVGEHCWWMGVALELERDLIRVVDRFAAAGIQYRVLKGSAVAHLDYPDPSMRTFGDVDVLVRGQQFDAAVRLLEVAGHRRRYPEPRPGFDRRFGKGSCLVSVDGREIDLHRTFAMGPFGLRIRLEDLWARSVPFRLAGRELLALAPEERFLHGCFHAALGSPVPRLTALRDVAQMMLCRPLDLSHIRFLSSAWRADAVVARAVSEAVATLGIAGENDLVQWAGRYRQLPGERRAMAVYVAGDQNYAAKSVAALRAIPRLSDKLAFAGALVFPRRSYLSGRHSGPLRRLRRGVSQAFGRREGQ